MSEMDPEVFKEYLAEVFESLEGLDEQFVKLERSPHDTQIVDAIFRPVHSIKGSSAFFGLEHITSFAHKLENLLDDIRKEKREATPQVIDYLLKGTDYLTEIFERLAAGDMEFKLKEEEEKFINTLEEQIAEGGGGQKDLSTVLEDMAQIIKDIRTSESSDAKLWDELEQNLQQVGKLTGTEVKEVEQKVELGKLGEFLVESGAAEREQIEKAVRDKGEHEKVGEALVRHGVVTKEQVDEAIHKQDEEKQKQEQKVAKMTAGVEKTMRIAEKKVDEFMDQIGELVIISEVFNYLEKRLSSISGASSISKEFKNANLNFSELTLRLQHGLSEVRKVQIKSIFQKIPRIVRDVATAVEKQVEVELEGEDVMLDKSLMEKLESPIIHMVRNSVDHGVEKPDVRKQRGKDPIGKVKVAAGIEGDILRVELSDDGGGLSKTKLLEKALSRGIIQPGQEQGMPDREVFDLIFNPGFSTADKVTDISGRGVGMDVVKRAITDSKGNILIESEEGKGSTFTITLPVSTTLVTINGLVTAVGKGKFIFPVEDVVESLRPSGKEVFSVKDKSEMVNIRGNIYPLVRLYDRFNIETEVMEPQDGVCLIINKNGKQCCVLTDSIVEQQNVVLKDLGAIFRQVRAIMGGAILGDGSIGLVLNVEGLMEGNG